MYYITEGLIKVSPEELQVFQVNYDKVASSYAKAGCYADKVEKNMLKGFAK